MVSSRWAPTEAERPAPDLRYGAKPSGTKPEAVFDALRNPIKIKEDVDNLGRPFKVYTGANARVVINPETGKIISTNPLTREGAHLP